MVIIKNVSRMRHSEHVEVPYKHRNRKGYRGTGSVASGFADSKLLCRRRLPCNLLFEGWHLPENESVRQRERENSFMQM